MLGTGFGTGYSPVAPGTVGSLLGILVYLPVAAPGRYPAYFILLFAVVAAGIWAAGVCGTFLGDHDSRRIVIDEVAGMLVTCFSFPGEARWLIAGFFVFRIFDIWKPFPIRRLDREWRSAGGVMADDILAGVYANLVLQASRALW